jgi:hypothetical protein
MRKLALAVALGCMILGAGTAMAWPPPPPDGGGGGAPEIDPSMVTGALAVLGGGLIVIRSIRRRK